MSMQQLTKIIDEGRQVSFFTSPYPDRGKYVCDVGSEDEEHFVFANSIEGLFNKLNRKEITKEEN